MHQSFKVNTVSSPERLFEVLSDLSLYPKWLSLVDQAEQIIDADDGPAWNVTLKAKLGPFARSKKLRMVRSTADSPNHVCFQRAEVDGLEHSPWTMNARISAGESPETSSVTIELAYGGELWSKALEAVLMSQIDDAEPKLLALLDS